MEIKASSANHQKHAKPLYLAVDGFLDADRESELGGCRCFSPDGPIVLEIARTWERLREIALEQSHVTQSHAYKIATIK